MPPGYLDGCLLPTPSSLGDRRLSVPIDCSVPAFAKAYRLLHAVLETASDDQLIRRSPSRIDGAGKEESDERQVIPLPVLLAVAVPRRTSEAFELPSDLERGMQSGRRTGPSKHDCDRVARLWPGVPQQMGPDHQRSQRGLMSWGF